MRELVEAYLAGADAVSRAVAGLTPEQLRAYPVAGTWSVLEVVCHMADAEALFADRIRRVLTEDRPALPVADPARQVVPLAYHAREAGEEGALVALIRRQMARVLQAQPPEAWGRVGVHPRDGEQTLAQVVRKAVAHLDHHLGFARAKRQALGVDPA